MSNRHAIITLGSNSFCLLVVSLQNDSFQEEIKFKKKVRLAEGLDIDGYLDADVERKALQCLSWFYQILQQHSLLDASFISVHATASLRQMRCADDFCRKALDCLPYPIDILSEEDEARLIFEGAQGKQKSKECCLVIDIGGASTELILGQAGTILTQTSFPMGSVRLSTELKNTSLNQVIYKDIKSRVQTYLTSFLTYKDIHSIKQVVGCSGVIRVLSEMRLASDGITDISARWLREFWNQIQEISPNVIDFNDLHADKRAILTGGVCLLMILFEVLDIESLSLSEGALREGLIYQQIKNKGA